MNRTLCALVGHDYRMGRLGSIKHCTLDPDVFMCLRCKKTKEAPATFYTPIDIPPVDSNEIGHENHNTTCKRLCWGRSYYKIVVDGSDIMSGNSQVDLWYCNDCKRSFIHDWQSVELEEETELFEYIIKSMENK